MLAIILVLLIVVCGYLYSQKRPANYPPGPYGIPILGNLLQLGPKPYESFVKLKEKYGPIVSVNFGSYPAVGISDYQIIREAQANPAFAGRPQLNVFQHRSRDKVARGLIFTDGRQWAEQRRFTIRQLKELGFAKTSLESMIQGEALDFVNALKGECDHPISLETKFHVPILNILWSMVVGERSTNTEANELFQKCTQAIQENNGLSAVCMFVPWFAKLFPKLSGMQDLNKHLEPLWKFFDKYIVEHKITYIPGQVRDFLDAYLQEMLDTTDPESSFYKETGEKSMLITLLDLFFAGGDTTANSIHWTCLYLAKHPDVQEILQNEIDSVIGRSRMAELSDESSMPYARAVIEESLRYASLLPLGMFHSTTEDVTLRGYTIPKDTMIIINTYGAHNDKEYWGDPEVFRPERHLDETGRFVKHEAMVTFANGRRSCIGETMARNQLFIWTITLFQNFKIITENPNISLDPVVSWLNLPPNHQLTFKSRSLI